MFANCIKHKGSRGLDDVAWGQLIDDLNRIAHGLSPNGEPLYTDPNGDEWGGIFLFAEGDLQQLCEGWGLPHYNAPAPRDMCGYCFANRSNDYPYTDTSRNAEWRSTEDRLTNEVFFRHVRAANPIYHLCLFCKYLREV